MSGYDALDELYERLRGTEDARRAGGITPETIRAARGGVADGYGRECHVVDENAADGEKTRDSAIHGDSRERIEADAWEAARLDMSRTWEERRDAIVALLDRQAALTESEYMERSGISELQAKVDELNAQNTRLNDGWAEANARAEKLQAELDHARSCPDCDCCGWKEKVDELQAELDKYKRHMWEYSMWHESTARMLGIGFDPENLPSDDEVQGEIERRICALQARVDELQVELDDIDGETYYGATIEEWHELAVRMEAERDVLRAELDACKLREKAAEDYDFRRAAEMWEAAYEGKCEELVSLQAVLDAHGNTHMELPLDADGVPIHVGDLIEFGSKSERLEVTHIGLTKHGDSTIAYRRPNGTLDCSCIGSECRHVKPRTVEDVLRDLVDGIGSVDFDALTAIDGAAAEIRELMGGE